MTAIERVRKKQRSNKFAGIKKRSRTQNQETDPATREAFLYG